MISNMTWNRIVKRAIEHRKNCDRVLNFHEIKYRYENWYLKLNKRYIMKQISIVWIVRYWRKCKSHYDFDNIIVFQNFQILFATSMIEYSCDLIVENLLNMSMQCQKLKIIEKSIKKVMHRMRRACIDAKNAKSNFSDLIKICQKIKSINMRKNQIFSTLFVFLDRIFVFDRFFVLQNRNVIITKYVSSKRYYVIFNHICTIRFLEIVLFDFIEFRMCNRFD